MKCVGKINPKIVRTGLRESSRKIYWKDMIEPNAKIQGKDEEES